MKERFKYVNQHAWIFYAFIALEITLGWIHEGNPFANWQGCLLIVALYLLGRASIDRELEIALDRAKAAIAKKTKK